MMRAAELFSAVSPFEADLDPETMWPRIRLNYANGWTASVVLHMPQTQGNVASLAAWPTGFEGRGLTQIGETEASPEEVADWLREIATRETCR